MFSKLSTVGHDYGSQFSTLMASRAQSKYGTVGAEEIVDDHGKYDEI